MLKGSVKINSLREMEPISSPIISRKIPQNTRSKLNYQTVPVSAHKE